QVDSMSNEDLVKGYKRQMLLLQKLKARSDDLQGKLKAKSDYEEVNITQQKCEDLTAQTESLKTTEANVKKQNNALNEELECLRMKQKTLLSSMQCLQEDHASISTSNEKLLSENEKSRNAMKDVEAEKMELADQIQDQVHQITELKSHIKKLSSDHVIKENLEAQNKDLKNELSAMKMTVDMLKSQKKPDQSDKINELNLAAKALNSEIECLKAQVSRKEEEKQIESSSQLQKNEELETKLQSAVKRQSEIDAELITELQQAHLLEQTVLKQSLTEEVQKNKLLNKTADDLKDIKAELEVKLESLESEKLTLSSTLDSLRAEHKSSEESAAQMSDVSTKLSEANSKLNEQVQRVTDVELENEELRKTIKSVKEEAEAAVLALEMEREKVKNLSTECENKEFQDKELRKEAADKDSQIQHLNERIESLLNQVDEFSRKSELFEEVSTKNEETLTSLTEAKAHLELQANEMATFCERERCLSVEIVELKEKLLQMQNDCETDLRKFTEENVELHKQVSEMESSGSQVSKDKEVMQVEIEQLKTDLSALHSENVSAKTSFDANVQQLAEVQQQNKELAIQLSNLQNQYDDVHRESMVLKETIGKQSYVGSEYNEMKMENQQLKEKCLSYSQNCHELEEKLEKLRLETDENVDRVKLEASALSEAAEGKIKHLECENSELKSDVLELQNELGKLRAGNEETLFLKQKLLESEALAMQFKDECSEMQEGYDRLQNKIKESDTKCGNLDDEVASLKIEMEKLVAVKNASSESIKQLQAELEQHEGSLKTLQEDHDKQVQELNNNIQSLTAAAITSENEITSLRMKLNEATALQENLQKTGTEFEAGMQEKLSISEKEKNSLQTELQELKDSLESLKIEKKELMDQSVEHLVCVEKEVQLLKEQQTDTVKNLQTTEALVVELKQSLNSTTAALTESRSTCENLQEKKFFSIEHLQKDSKEKDILNNKLKILAVKAKKERDSAKMQLQVSQEEAAQLKVQVAEMETKLKVHQTQASNVQMMQLECDKLQDDVDNIRLEKVATQKSLDEALNQLSTSQVEKAKLSEQLDTLTTDLQAVNNSKSDVEKQLCDTRSLVSTLEKEQDSILKEKLALKQEIEATKIQIATLSKSSDDSEKKYRESQNALKDAEKNLKQHGLMSLEIEQYEKTIEGLESNIQILNTSNLEQKSEIICLNEKINDVQEERREVEKLRIEAEERVTKTKEALDATKDELEKLQSVEKELKIQIKEKQTQVQSLMQENEQQKLDLASQSSDQRMLQEQIVALKSSSARNIDVLERKVHSAQVEVDLLLSEKERLKHDYESYKVRVHSVLKQQKSKETPPTAPQDTTEINSLKQTLEQIHIKLSESQNILASREGELDLLQGDYDRLLRQQQESSDSAVEREARWKSRVKSLQQELASMRKQFADATRRISEQEGLVSAANQIEISSLKEEHQKTVVLLKEDVAHLERELLKARTDAKHRTEEKPESHPSAVSSVDYRSVTREDGEGEENPDLSSVVSFEQILQSPTQIKSASPVGVLKRFADYSLLSRELQLKQLESRFEAQSKQLEHLSEVARENEATTARLMDQNRVLKEEIRRLEKNQERQTSVANLEYLKNVVCKFATLPPCDEKQHLLPVLDTMLKLTPEERQTLETVALGENADEPQAASGWGSYLQRWSGMQ
uniref:GRIP domain-containing protein n=1 Tax=Ciona savignyi TaxID=51511 RepID=H2ZHP7_CIOSA